MYVVVMSPNSLVDVEAVQQLLNQHAMDWYRFAPGCWTVVSGLNAEALTNTLRPLVPADGNIFVSRLNTADHQGWMAQKFWDWFNRNRFR